MTFSARMPTDLTPNRLSAALEGMRSNGLPFLDLTLSNPTRAGFDYPADLLAPLANPRGLVYAPAALGLPDARHAVSEDFARRGLAVPPASIVLTASTSEAYSLIFKVLCDPGDEVLVPRPSYPLFDHLTRLDGVTAVPYDLDYHGAWTLDLSSIERACSPRTRAVLVVSPNNPTGNLIAPAELDAIDDLCRSRDAAIILDEVFAEYELADGAGERSGRLFGRRGALGFTLGGLSKSVALPQAKLGWIALTGEHTLVDDARSRLELACDTYLSVSTPVQAAARELLTAGARVREQIQQRVRANYQCLHAIAATAPSCTALRADGGWYGILQVPSLMPEDELVLALLTEDRVLVHPGYFFDFPRESFLVLSLLAPEVGFADGLHRIVRRVAPVPTPS